MTFMCTNITAIFWLSVSFQGTQLCHWTYITHPGSQGEAEIVKTHRQFLEHCWLNFVKLRYLHVKKVVFVVGFFFFF